MERRAIQVQVAGQSYRVVSSASAEDLRRLASVVDAKVSETVAPGRTAPPQAVLLAALALAHEVEEERSRRQALERKTRDLLRRVLLRIDDALEPFEDPAVDQAD
jgi:cell division protein ZapA